MCYSTPGNYLYFNVFAIKYFYPFVIRSWFIFLQHFDQLNKTLLNILITLFKIPVIVIVVPVISTAIATTPVIPTSTYSSTIVVAASKIFPILVTATAIFIPLLVISPVFYKRPVVKFKFSFCHTA